MYEHQRLRVGELGFTQTHLDALGKLNEYHDGAYFEMISRGIKFSQYVGVIQVDGTTIEIHPKSDKHDESDQWKNVLLQMLEKCGRLKAQSAGAAHVRRQNLNLLEVYFELFLTEVSELIRRGLIKKYRNESKNVRALKGKLDFAQNIRHNAVHKERFYTTHQVYDVDHLLNQTLAQALSIVEHYTRGTRLFDVCKRVQLDFPEVKVKSITAQELNSIELNRKSAPYGYALELARLIILNYSPDISSGNERMLALLFDMNQLWEEYVLVSLRKYIRENSLGIEVTGQDSRSFWGSNSLRPDIVLKYENQTYVVDTKWKTPKNRTASISDLRQMYTYNRFWDAPKAMLLYPGESRGNAFMPFQTDDYHSPEDDVYHKIEHECKMGFVHVLDENGNLAELGSTILSHLGIVVD